LGTRTGGTRPSGACPQASQAWKYADIGVHEFRILVTAGSPAGVSAMMPGLADHLAAPPLAYAHLPYDSGRAPSVEPLLDVCPASIRLLACKRSWDGEALIVRLQEAVGRKTVGEMRISPKSDQTEGGMRLGPVRPGQERGHVPEVHVPIVHVPPEHVPIIDPAWVRGGRERGHVPPEHVPLREERGRVPSEHVPNPVPVRSSIPAPVALPICLDFRPFEIKTLRVERDGTWRPVRMVGEDKI